MIQFRENNFVPFFQIKYVKYDYIKYVHVTCVELWFVFFSVSKTGIWRGVRSSSNLAPESSSFLLEAKRLWIRDWMGRSIKTWVRFITAAMLTVKNSLGTQKILRKKFIYILLVINPRATNMAAISFCLQTKNGRRKENVYFLWGTHMARTTLSL